MNCPECGKRMIAEACPYVIEVSGGMSMIGGEILQGRTVPSIHYRCEDCDAEWLRFSGGKGLRLLDSAQHPPLQPSQMKGTPEDSADDYGDTSEP